MKSSPISQRRIHHVVILSMVLTWLGCHGFTLPRIPFVNVNHHLSRRLIPNNNIATIITSTSTSRNSMGSTTSLPAAAASLATTDYSSLAQPVPYGPHLSIKGKVLNGWGVLYAVCVFSVAVLVLPFMFITATFADLTGNGPRRKMCDWIVHVWANMALQMTLCNPKVYGLENLPKPGETVMYVPNHTSFMDILVLSGFVPRPFKYLSKSEIMDIPVIGWAMNLAKHVFLKRDDLKSTMEVTETCVQRLKDGNSMVLFAEGTRSPDGALRPFKKGAFQMAKEAGVRIVPVSIGNLHRWMPKDAVLPLAPIRQVYVQIHPPIETKDQKISQVRAACFEAVNSGLPAYQQAPAALPGGTKAAEE